MSDRLIP